MSDNERQTTLLVSIGVAVLGVLLVAAVLGLMTLLAPV